MPVLTIRQGDHCRQISFQGAPLLSELLNHQGHAHPCGGRGICKKCAVRASGALSPPTPAETGAGTRLSCQTRLLGDCQVWLPEDVTGEIELSGHAPALGTSRTGYGAAVDIGTTTLALKLYDLGSGALLAAEGALNPQRSIAADVMGRIGAAMAGLLRTQQTMVLEALEALLRRACSQAGIDRSQLSWLVITGNTTMLYLLQGRDPACLSAAPFRADCLFGREERLWDIPVYYPPCISAFVGADITCAILDSGMVQKTETALLCDIGTNGELALWHHGTLYVSSTAAGPAFEGAGISCGCSSIPGAIDRVWLEDGDLQIRTIGNQSPVGLCGSGLVDAIAVFLKTGDIEETGATELDILPLAGDVHLTPGDIRAVQLAKAAIAAGIKTLLDQAGISEAAVETVYITGGFGSHLNVDSMADIGLLPAAWKSKVQVLGNAALSGAAALLLDPPKQKTAAALAARGISVDLGGNSRFNRHFMEQILFGDTDLFE